MATEREIQETIARSVAIMVCFHNSEKTKRAGAMMVSEVQTVAGMVLELDLGVGETDDCILRPVEQELLMRYGHEVGPRLNTEFLKAFESLDASGRGTRQRHS